MKRNTAIISTIGLLVILLLLVAGCQKTPNIQPDTFTASYEIGQTGRSVSISGNGNGIPGEQSLYILNINNNSEPWQDEYSIQLTSNGSVIQEISHGRLNLHGNDGTQQPIMVKFPVGVEGPLGLSFVVPQRGPLLTVFLSITGQKDANITTCSPTRINESK
jgi:hypothetical protein